MFLVFNFWHIVSCVESGKFHLMQPHCSYNAGASQLSAQAKKQDRQAAGLGLSFCLWCEGRLPLRPAQVINLHLSRVAPSDRRGALPRANHFNRRAFARNRLPPQQGSSPPFTGVQRR